MTDPNLKAYETEGHDDSGGIFRHIVAVASLQEAVTKTIDRVRQDCDAAGIAVHVTKASMIRATMVL